MTRKLYQEQFKDDCSIHERHWVVNVNEKLL